MAIACVVFVFNIFLILAVCEVKMAFAVPLVFGWAPTAVSAAVLYANRELWAQTAVPAAPAMDIRQVLKEIGLKEGAAMGVTVLACGAVYKSGFVGGTVRLTASLIPGFRWAWKKVSGAKVVTTVSSPLILESRREGSEEVPLTMPKCQCRVAVMRDGDLHVIGCAVRFDDGWLVGPDHVLGGDILIEKYAVGSQSHLSLKGKERVPLDTDLVGIQLTEAEFARIGVSICRIEPVPSRGLLAMIVGPDGKGTTGAVYNDPGLFGRVTYAGTTVGGYSGAAYAAGARVLGLHQMGGPVNGGFSASYVWAMIRMVSGKRYETEEWIEGQYKAGKKIKIRKTGSPDETQVCIDGQYSIVQSSSLNKVFGTRWHDVDELSYGDPRGYEDYESKSMESGEASSSTNPGGLSLLARPGDLDLPPQRSLINGYRKLSKRQQKEFRNSLGFIISPAKSTPGPTEVAVESLTV